MAADPLDRNCASRPRKATNRTPNSNGLCPPADRDTGGHEEEMTANKATWTSPNNRGAMLGMSRLSRTQADVKAVPDWRIPLPQRTLLYHERPWSLGQPPYRNGLPTRTPRIACP